MLERKAVVAEQADLEQELHFQLQPIQPTQLLLVLADPVERMVATLFLAPLLPMVAAQVATEVFRKTVPAAAPAAEGRGELHQAELAIRPLPAHLKVMQAVVVMFQTTPTVEVVPVVAELVKLEEISYLRDHHKALPRTLAEAETEVHHQFLGHQ